MAELRTEEEQIQAIKDWWKKNGSSLLIGIGAALAIVFGWQAWQNHQAQQRTEAANQFANLLNAFSDQADETSGETVAFVAQTLREDFCLIISLNRQTATPFMEFFRDFASFL